MDFERLQALVEPELQHISQQYQGVVASCSGGPDSTALFHLLCDFAKQKKSFHLALYHLNFGLRGKESAADQRFCEDLARSHDQPCFVRQVPVSESGRRRDSGVGIQSWARELRRQGWQEWIDAGWCIATGHTMNDLAETALFRLARGTTPGSLAGMTRRDGDLWRPLLHCPKSDLLSYLNHGGHSFRIDASNAKTDYARNRIRHLVLPVLEEISPGATAKIAATASAAHELQLFVASQIKEAESTDDLPAAIEQTRTVARLQQLGFHHPMTRDQIEAVTQFLANPAKTHHNLPGGGILTRQGQKFIITAQDETHKTLRQQQHERNLSRVQAYAQLSGRAYGILKNSRGIYQLGGDLPGQNATIWEICPAPASQKLRFRGYNKRWILKELLARWQVPVEQRKHYQVVRGDNECICLTDGTGCYVPDDTGERLTLKEFSGIVDSYR